jgi:hypothetical protein
VALIPIFQHTGPMPRRADPNGARMIENIARHEIIHSLLFELGEASDGVSMTMRSRSALESRVEE